MNDLTKKKYLTREKNISLFGVVSMLSREAKKKSLVTNINKQLNRQTNSFNKL